MAKESILTLSTAHLTSKDLELLSADVNDDSCVPRIADHQHGWIVFLALSKDGFYDAMSQLEARGYSHMYRQVLIVARGRRCQYVDFDSSAEEDDEVYRCKGC